MGSTPICSLPGGDEIALAAVQLLDRPVGAADIVFGGELAIRIGHVGVNQLVALIDAVLSTGQVRVTLGRAGFHILLGNSQVPFLEHVIEALVGHLVPLDCRRLLIGDDIADRSVHLFQRVTCADQNVAKGRNAAGISHSILIHGNAAVGRAVQMELQTFVEPILCGLSDLEIAALQVVVEALIGDLVPLDCRSLIVGDNIAVGSADFLEGIAGADQHIIKDSDTAGIGDGIFVHRQSAVGSAIEMKLDALDQPVLCGLGNLEVTAAQSVVEGYGRGLAADDGNGLCRLCLVLVIGKLRHSIGAGEQVEVDSTVLTGRDRLIDSIAGDVELDALNLAVFAGFHDMADALGFRVQLEVEEHGIFRAGSHRLLAGTAPNEHLAHTEVGLLLRGDHHGTGDHVLAREGILISAAGDGNAAGREIDVGESVVGVGQGNAVVVICLIVLHRVGLRIALIAGGEARHNVVSGHLLQDPVVAFLGRSALNGVVVHIRVNAVVGGNGGRAGTGCC